MDFYDWHFFSLAYFQNSPILLHVPVLLFYAIVYTCHIYLSIQHLMNTCVVSSVLALISPYQHRAFCPLPPFFPLSLFLNYSHPSGCEGVCVVVLICIFLVTAVCLPSSFSSVWLCKLIDYSLPGLSVHGIESPGKNTGMSHHALLQGNSRPRNQTCISYLLHWQVTPIAATWEVPP